MWGNGGQTVTVSICAGLCLGRARGQAKYLPNGPSLSETPQPMAPWDMGLGVWHLGLQCIRQGMMPESRVENGPGENWKTRICTKITVWSLWLWGKAVASQPGGGEQSHF